MELEKLASLEKDKDLQRVLLKTSETLENTRRLEAKSAADEDLKESDTLRYFQKDTKAAKVCD